MPLSLEERLQRVEDELAIAQLRARYCHLLDGRDWEAFIDLFTEDGHFAGLQEVRGRDALLRFFRDEVPLLAEDFWHFCTNGTVEIDGDTARGRISMEYLSTTKGVPHISAGHYDDELLRVDGRWRFRSRRITFYFLAPLREGWAGRPLPRPANQP